jgi:glycerophosphoryl diester phosphodiesterase
MLIKDKKVFLRVVVIGYIILSAPPVFYTGSKVVKKIQGSVMERNTISKNVNDDFYMENERSGGGVANKNALLIAHAGGALFGADGEMITYTNSLEALEQNYQRGHRVFEIDFSLTKDGKLAAVHDWNHGKAITQAEWADVPTLDEWKTAKIHGKYTPLDINDIVDIMQKYKYICIVTDTKETREDLVLKQFTEIYKAAERVDIEIMDRFIPQIYYPQMLKTIYEVYPFASVIYTLYQSGQSDAEVLEFVNNHDSIYAVTMWSYKATEFFVNELIKLNKRIYVHTINAFEEAYQIMQSGVSGLYTDYLY